MQSGARRKSFSLGPCPEGVHTKYRRPPGKQKNEERSVTGLATDSLNRVVIVSTLDGTVNVRAHHMILKMVINVFCNQFFDFHTAKLAHVLIIPATVVSIALQRDSGLLAVTCDDLVVRLVDIETRRIVREFGGFSGRVLDLVGSPILDPLSNLDDSTRRLFPPTRGGSSRHRSTQLSGHLIFPLVA